MIWNSGEIEDRAKIFTELHFFWISYVNKNRIISQYRYYMHTPKIEQLKLKHVYQKQTWKLINSYQMYETGLQIELVANFLFLLFSEGLNKQNKLADNK